jgi:hypothetical protein
LKDAPEAKKAIISDLYASFDVKNMVAIKIKRAKSKAIIWGMKF